MYFFKAIAEAVILGGVLWQCEFLRLLLYVYSTVSSLGGSFVALSDFAVLTLCM